MIRPCPRGAAPVVALLLAAALVATGCGAKAPTAGGPATTAAATSTTTPGPAPLTPDVTTAALTIGLPGDPAQWNPLAAPGPDPVLQTVAGAVLPSAYVVGPGLLPAMNPQLLTAASVVSEEPETVEYTINPAAVWSDGNLVTAADFVYTWEADSGQSRFRDLDGAAFTPASTVGYDQVASVRAGSSTGTVIVTFATPDVDWQALFSPLLPADVASDIGFDDGFTNPVTDLVSAGPFVVQSWQPGADIVLVRNPAWWGPAPDLSTVQVDMVPEAAVAGESLLTGQLDAAVMAFTPGAAKTLRTIPGLTTATYGTGDFDDVLLDERRGPFTSAAVRRAVLLAIDRSALAHVAQTEEDTNATSVANRAFLPGQPGYRDDRGDLGTGGLSEALSLLAGAGYTLSGTTLEHAGEPVVLRLAVTSRSPLAGLEVTAVVSACRALGFGVEVLAGGPAAAGAALQGDGWDVAVVTDTVSPFLSSLASAYGAGNETGYASAAMEADLQQVDTLPNGPARTAAADAVDAQAWQDAVDLPLLYVPQIFAVQSRYSGLAPTPGPAGPAWDVARWALPAKT